MVICEVIAKVKLITVSLIGTGLFDFGFNFF